MARENRAMALLINADWKRMSLRRVIILVSLAALGALAIVGYLAGTAPRELVQTPTRYLDNGFPHDEIPEEHKSATAALLYATDRLPINGDFTAERSNALIFGTVEVALGQDATWEELVDASQTTDRAGAWELEMTDFRELGRVRDTPLPFTLEDGLPVDLPWPRAVYGFGERSFQRMLSNRLATSAQKEVIIYVHGFNNSFVDSAKNLAEIWHFTGRWGVPLLYTWPAGRGGLLGYLTDRESGEFTVFHLKETLRLVAAMPEVERVHVLAHSRGTDVVTSALRELIISARASGQDPREALKIRNLILAAPDLDYAVVGQRLIAERFIPAFERISVYTSEGDGALGLSMWLMEGQRFGRLQAGGLSMDEERIFENIRNVGFINVPETQTVIGHSYYRDSPEALSDIIAMIRDDAEPGSPERPLTHLGGSFWEIPVEPER